MATNKDSQARAQPSLFDVAVEVPVEVPVETVPVQVEVPTAPDPDADARQFAVDPRNHVVLEASAGTGKTSVLVARYVNLLKAGVDPSNILAITFTRKAAAEMRERILHELRAAASRSEIDKARWVELRDRLGDIAISTIDAFCLSLLREFPLEADLDPWQQANLREMRRRYRHAHAVEPALVEALARATTACEMTWREARPSRVREMPSWAKTSAISGSVRASRVRIRSV